MNRESQKREEMTDGWKGKLESEVGIVELVYPDIDADQIAIKQLASGDVDSPCPFQYAFKWAERRDPIISKFPESRYAAYARYWRWKHYLKKFNQTNALEYAENALADFQAIDGSSLDRLFREEVAFNLVQTCRTLEAEKEKTKK